MDVFGRDGYNLKLSVQYKASALAFLFGTSSFVWQEC